MMIVSDSDVELTPGFQLGARHGRAVTGHELATSASAMRDREVVPRFLSSPLWQPLYVDADEG